MGFRAFRVEKNDSGFTRSIIERDESELPKGDLLIDVKFSSLNYKDGLSATGNPGVTRTFPILRGLMRRALSLNQAIRTLFLAMK